MKTLKLLTITEAKAEKTRTDGKVSRLYYTASFTNPSNPFAKSVSRVFWQQHNSDGTKAEWKGADPIAVRAFIGKEIPGTIVSHEVAPYEIVDQSTGNVREASTFTAVVLDGETDIQVFKQSGKTIVKAAALEIKEEETAAF